MCCSDSRLFAFSWNFRVLRIGDGFGAAGSSFKPVSMLFALFLSLICSLSSVLGDLADFERTGDVGSGFAWVGEGCRLALEGDVCKIFARVAAAFDAPSSFDGDFNGRGGWFLPPSYGFGGGGPLGLPSGGSIPFKRPPAPASMFCSSEALSLFTFADRGGGLGNFWGGFEAVVGGSMLFSPGFGGGVVGLLLFSPGFGGGVGDLVGSDCRGGLGRFLRPDIGEDRGDLEGPGFGGGVGDFVDSGFGGGVGELDGLRFWVGVGVLGLLPCKPSSDVGLSNLAFSWLTSEAMTHN